MIENLSNQLIESLIKAI
jgi:hypothetical protein